MSFKLYDRVYNNLSESIPATIIGCLDPNEFFINKDTEFILKHSHYYQLDPQWLDKNIYYIKYDHPSRINSLELVENEIKDKLKAAGLSNDEIKKSAYLTYEQLPRTYIAYAPEKALERIQDEV